MILRPGGLDDEDAQAMCPDFDDEMDSSDQLNYQSPRKIEVPKTAMRNTSRVNEVKCIVTVVVRY